MADEDSGFTFVDKRRTSAETPVETVVEPPVESIPETAEEEALDGDEMGDAPSIYAVLGYCISLLATEAWQKLGLLADPKTGEAAADLVQAKVAIDAAGDLAARLEAAPPEEVPDRLRRDLKTLINDLRLNYVAQRGDTAVSRN